MPIRKKTRRKRGQKYPKNLPRLVLSSKPADWRWIPYEMCKELTNMAGIKSYRQYRAWVRDYYPGGIPSRPEAYYKEWTGWRDFLKTDNVYRADSPGAMRKDDMMEFWEAVGLVQPLQLKTAIEYRQAYDDGLIPKGIPRWPQHRYYNEFNKGGGWKNFLGKDVKHRVIAKTNVKPLLILYRANKQAGNVLSIIIHKTGVSTMMQMVRERELDVVKIYNWYDDFANEIFELMNRLGSQQTDTSWMFNNINDVLWELSSYLEPFVLKKN